MPVSLVIRKFNVTLIALGVVILTALILKKTWYDHLDERERRPAPSPVATDARAQSAPRPAQA